MRRPVLALVPLLFIGAFVAACTESEASSTSEGEARVVVAVAFYPIEEIVRAVGGDTVDVVDLTPPGGAPHDLEVTPQTAEDLEGADVVFYLGRGFQPAVEDAVGALPDSVSKVDLLDRVELLPVTPQLAGTQGEVDGETLEGDVDPHIWVDPANMILLTDAVAATLSQVAADEADTFDAGAARYTTELQRLDDDFSTGLAECRSRTIVTSHRAFEYLARRYDLVQVPIAGISPDEEPDPRSLEAVADVARRDHVTVVFFESQVPRELSETVAREIGATTDALDPIETLTQDQTDAGATYLTIQRANLAALERALVCT